MSPLFLAILFSAIALAALGLGIYFAYVGIARDERAALTVMWSLVVASGVAAVATGVAAGVFSKQYVDQQKQKQMAEAQQLQMQSQSPDVPM